MYLAPLGMSTNNEYPFQAVQSNWDVQSAALREGDITNKELQ